jgi:hypothetical protein
MKQLFPDVMVAAAHYRVSRCSPRFLDGSLQSPRSRRKSSSGAADATAVFDPQRAAADGAIEYNLLFR